MRTIATALLVGALALWGCGEGSSNGKTGGASSEGSSANAGTPKPAPGATNATGAGTKKTPPSQQTIDASTLDRASAEGTLGLFVVHMQQGEFQDALMLTDPESSGYALVEQAVNVLAESSKKGGDDQGITLEALMRAFMSRGWQGAVYEPLTVQEERARFELKLVDHDMQTMDLRKIDGDWYVVAPDWVIVKGDVSDLMPAGKPAPPAGATPTPPAPAPAGGSGK